MKTSEPLDINVVFSATARPRKLRVRRPPAAPAAGRRVGVVIGVIGLLFAGGLAYVTWWQADPFIYGVFTWSTPVPGVDANQVALQLFPKLASSSDLTPPTVTDEESAAAIVTGVTATGIISGVAYTWLTVTQIAACALALSAGALWGRISGVGARRIGLILAALVFIVIVYVTYTVYAEYGTYKPRHLRVGMCILVGLAALVGLSIGRGVRGWTRFAAIALIVSAAVTGVGVYLWGLCEAISPEWSSVSVAGVAFIIQSLYGWLLLSLTN
ncbi:MAG: hypothetical protein KJ749_05480, partial [Planctomycetes bacterium]|nr:hypothetical protein [Planctomycetota bacterium]